MRVIFMGTPDFSVPALEKLSAEHEVIAVVTQPDKPKGRSGKLIACPVKEKALELGLKVLQPERARDEAFISEIKALNPDMIIVIAYGQILPGKILELPKYGCVNVHASLLPKYRGAAPIQWAVINGDKVSGVTTMLMNEGLDTGDILLAKEVELKYDETGGSLFERLSSIGAGLMLETITGLENGEITPIPQDDSKASKVGLLTKAMGELDFNKSSRELERLVRGLDPWPGAFTYIDGKKLSIWKCIAEKMKHDKEAVSTGAVSDVGKDYIDISCREGCLRLLEVQLEGKKRMNVRDFLNGFEVKRGDKLGRGEEKQQ